MSIEAITILWGIIPAGVALLACIVSIAAAKKRKTVLQVIGASLVILFTAVSLWTLKEMFIDEVWPTYIPHILIGVSAVIAFAQWFGARGAKKNA